MIAFEFPSGGHEGSWGRVDRLSAETGMFSGEEERLVVRIISPASKYGRYGYRRVTALVRAEGWRANHKRVERIWRQVGLKLP